MAPAVAKAMDLEDESGRTIGCHPERSEGAEASLAATAPPFRLNLLLGAGPELPEGFRYRPDIISRPLKFHGFTAKRRVISYGWKYDFEKQAVQKAEDMPDWLLPLREVAAGFAGIAPEQLQQALVMEYGVGAAIGWHRDKAVFGDVIGFSLLSACRFRLRRKVGTKWERASLIADARSAYLLRGPSRTEWEHSIPAVDALRYSITFRILRGDR